jgi:hypothetical protein
MTHAGKVNEWVVVPMRGRTRRTIIRADDEEER